jgi:hypothetical protein
MIPPVYRFFNIMKLNNQEGQYYRIKKEKWTLP